jgi:hypothetical protein
MLNGILVIVMADAEGSALHAASIFWLPFSSRQRPMILLAGFALRSLTLLDFKGPL